MTKWQIIKIILWETNRINLLWVLTLNHLTIMNRATTILDKIKNAPALDFGIIFSTSIELFKKTWVQGFLLQIFTFVVMLPLIIILYIPLITMAIAQAKTGSADSNMYGDFFAGLSILYILFIFVGILVLGAVQVALQSAFFKIMKRLDHGETVVTSDFFYFIKGKYLTKALMLTLVSVLIAIPAVLLCYVPLLYVMVPMSFFTMIFAFNPELNVGDIVKLSFSIGNKKWLLIFGLIFVSSLASQFVGLLLCGVGVLFTTAFVHHPVYLIYKDVIGFDNTTEIDSIGDSEV